MTAAFRRAEARDLGTVADLSARAYAPYVDMFGYPPLPVTEDYAPRIERGEVWLLENGSELLGLLVLEKQTDHLLIYSVAVAPGQQGNGLGQRLLDFADQQGRAAGCKEIRLYTNARMERNISIYAAHGYHETGRRPHPSRSDATVVDMAKALDRQA